MSAEPLGRDRRHGVESGANRLGERFESIELPRGREHVRRVGPLLPARLEEPALLESREHRVEEYPLGAPLDKPRSELAQHREVEAGIV